MGDPCRICLCDFSLGGCYIIDDLWQTTVHCCEIMLKRARKTLLANWCAGMWTSFTRPRCGPSNGDVPLAKDVSQSVFIDLARKASRLANRSVLNGWFYTSACFAAANAVRSERRRQAREQEAHAMQEQTTSTSDPTDWDKIRTVLMP